LSLLIIRKMQIKTTMSHPLRSLVLLVLKLRFINITSKAYCENYIDAYSVF
jgi:hypothetical protein